LDQHFSIYDASAAPEIDIERLAYFAASVLWRGSAHTWRFRQEVLRKIPLGPYQEELRQYLLGLNAFPQNAVFLIDVIGDENLRMGTYPPFGGKREDGSWCYTFPFFGIIFTIVLGNTIKQSLREHCTYRSPRHFITRGVTRTETMLEWAFSLLRKSRPVGKLSKKSPGQ
jgi:hypothetical protein